MNTFVEFFEFTNSHNELDIAQEGFFDSIKNFGSRISPEESKEIKKELDKISSVAVIEGINVYKILDISQTLNNIVAQNAAKDSTFKNLIPLAKYLSDMDDTYNCCISFIDKIMSPIIAITSKLLNASTSEHLQFIYYHEYGHLVNNHQMLTLMNVARSFSKNEGTGLKYMSGATQTLAQEHEADMTGVRYTDKETGISALNELIKLYPNPDNPGVKEVKRRIELIERDVASGKMGKEHFYFNFENNNLNIGNEWSLFGKDHWYDKPFKLYYISYKKDHTWTSTTISQEYCSLKYPTRIFLGARSDDLRLPYGNYGDFTFKIKNTKLLQEKVYILTYDVRPNDFNVKEERNNSSSIDVEWKYPIKPSEYQEITLGKLLELTGYKYQIVDKNISNQRKILVKNVFNIADQTLKAMSKLPFFKGIKNLTKDPNKYMYEDDYPSFINGNADELSMYRIDLHEMSNNPRDEYEELWEQIDKWIVSVNSKIKNNEFDFDVIDTDWDEGTIGLKSKE